MCRRSYLLWSPVIVPATLYIVPMRFFGTDGIFTNVVRSSVQSIFCRLPLYIVPVLLVGAYDGHCCIFFSSKNRNGRRYKLSFGSEVSLPCSNFSLSRLPTW